MLLLAIDLAIVGHHNLELDSIAIEMGVSEPMRVLPRVVLVVGHSVDYRGDYVA
jgi:hypothetical protein